MQKETRYSECFVPDLVSTVDLVHSSRNNQYVDFGNNVEDQVRYISLTKHAAAVMFLSLVCSSRNVSSLILFDGSFRLNANRYIDIMTLTIIPWMRKVVGKKKFVFQQDRAPAHMTNKMQAFLEKKIDFWPKSMWPPQSLDLNPLDYSV